MADELHYWAVKKAPKVKKKDSNMARKPKGYTDPVAYPDWVDFKTCLSPAILKEALRFTKEHDLIMSQMVNSAIKVFISEADEYVKEQTKKKEWLYSKNMNDVHNQSFRFTNAHTTKDEIEDEFTPISRRVKRAPQKAYEYGESQKKPQEPKTTKPQPKPRTRKQK
jgi:hypothetical protein